MGGILIDYAIRRAVQNGQIKIEPYKDEQMNPASYDLTLGDEVAVYSNVVNTSRPPTGVNDGSHFSPIEEGVLDVKAKPEVETFKIDKEVGWLLVPGIGYLAHTVERVGTDNFVPMLNGKSSIGRLFVEIHRTAGLGDPSFFGQYTLEVAVMHRVRVYPGMRICQILFHSIDAGGSERTCPDKPYAGNYVGKLAEGPVASRAYKQFG